MYIANGHLVPLWRALLHINLKDSFAAVLSIGNPLLSSACTFVTPTYRYHDPKQLAGSVKQLQVDAVLSQHSEAAVLQVMLVLRHLARAVVLMCV